MRRLLLLGAVGCAHELPDDQACIEVGYAIAARTEACTGDVDAAVARQEALEADYACAIPELLDPSQEQDLFGCALVLRNLACEVAAEHGDDLDAWLSSSPMCGTILEPR